MSYFADKICRQKKIFERGKNHSVSFIYNRFVDGQYCKLPIFEQSQKYPSFLPSSIAVLVSRVSPVMTLRFPALWQKWQNISLLPNRRVNSVAGSPLMVAIIGSLEK
jgi:hypothetical protein